MKCVEYKYEGGFPYEYKEIILDSDGCKNIMTLAKVQPFFRIYDLDIGVYNLNSKRILPWTVKEKNNCLYFYKNHSSVTWK